MPSLLLAWQCHRCFEPGSAIVVFSPPAVRRVLSLILISKAFFEPLSFFLTENAGVHRSQLSPCLHPFRTARLPPSIHGPQLYRAASRDNLRQHRSPNAQGTSKSILTRRSMIVVSATSAASPGNGIYPSINAPSLAPMWTQVLS